MLMTKVVKSQNTHFIFNDFLRKIVLFMRCGKKYGGAREAIDDYNTTHAFGMLDN
jgi:hypothetical protein